METPLLQTKLYIPPTRPELVSRPRLIERLNEGVHRKLTLISAPAGFGKTMLVSDWLRQLIESTAWVSLDESDNDPVRFLTYFVAALQTIEASIGKGALSTLQSPHPPPTEALLTSLINDVATLPNRIILVLDDYHIIDSSPIDDALTFLLEHLPPQMHLVVATRDDPLLPLARLRARGQLTELRVADLRFTLSEAARFLNQVMGLTLSTEEIAALETRTEGWIAGLQMAALALQGPSSSIQGRTDTASFISDFIAAFTGSHHFVLDYLVEEVLQRQTERVRDFLLQTSILERLSGSLCDAVCSEETDVNRQKDGKEMLKALERGNLFVVPLDDQRRWYRYHHLFADVLQTHLMEEQPHQVPTMHRRASEWYERNGLPVDAVRHALAAEDFERAAALLVELVWSATFKDFQPATWLGWVKTLPDELVRARPVLSVGYAWMLLDGGELEAAEARLRDAEWWLDTTTDMNERPEAPSPEMVVVNEEEFRSLPASIASARAYLAQALGDVPSTVTYARRALDLLPEGDYYERGIAAMFLGLAYWTSGDLEAAYQSLADSVTSLHMAENIYFQIVGTVVLADIRVVQGRLQEAESTYEQALQLAAEQGEPVLQGTADLYVGLSELHRERGDLKAATQHLLRGKELGEQAVSPGSEYRLCAAMARIKVAQGDLDGALDLLHEAERLYKRDPIPDVRPVAALKTRVWVRQGRLTEALGWAREQGLSVDDDLSYLRQFEHITLVRVLIAEYKSERVERSIHEAMGLLERLLQAAKAGGRTGSVIEVLVLQALAHQAQGDIPLALVALEHALTLAEPEGYVRIFVDEGPPMEALLKKMRLEDGRPVLSEVEGMRKYVYKLLAAFSDKESPPPSPSPQPLIDPLSKRECEVLKLLTTELSGPEIAKELMVSMNTIRTHTKNIYSKLGVNSRRDAVRQAKELKLI